MITMISSLKDEVISNNENFVHSNEDQDRIFAKDENNLSENNFENNEPEDNLDNQF